MSEQKSSKSSKGKGNTKPFPKRQISPAKRWAFTINNYDSIIIKSLSSIVPLCNYLIVGKETGEKGTPHLQAYVEFKNKLRPLSLGLSTTIHWEKAKGNRLQNEEYCKKDGSVIKELLVGFFFSKPLKLIKRNSFYLYQEAIVQILEQEPHPRKIYWYWERDGNSGKSALCKWICSKMNALILSNKASDMKNGILQMYNNTGRYPEIIIIDIPRSVDLQYLSYTGIEEVKNGCFYSPKYEGGMCLFNSPHLIVFSNELPNTNKLSSDRWKISEITI